MRPHKFDIEGHTHFVTTNVARRQPLFISRVLAQIVLHNLRYYSAPLNYELVGYVIMPDHVHALIYPRTKTPISKIVQCVKKYAAKEIIAAMREGQELDLVEFASDLQTLRNERAACLASEYPTLDTFFDPSPAYGKSLP